MARELPRTGGSSFLEGGFLAGAAPSFFHTGTPLTAAALVCVLAFLGARAPTPARKHRSARQAQRSWIEWAVLAAALLAVSALLSWLYAGLGGLASREPTVFIASVTALLVILVPLEGLLRRRPRSARWFARVAIGGLVMMVATALGGTYLGSESSFAWLGVAVVVFSVLAPFILAALGAELDGGGGQSYSSSSSHDSTSSYGSSSSSSSSSGSSSYGGGGGGFGGGGASSSW